MAKPIPGAVVTCDYDDPSGCAAGECGFHTGRDYRADIGTPVHASKAGKVVFAGAHTPAPGDDWGGAYGTQVIIDTSGIRHLYAHLSEVSVAKGQLVKAGDHVGLSGDTGNTHGPHLHYEERVHPYGHCPNNREPQFDKEPETDDITVEELMDFEISTGQGRFKIVTLLANAALLPVIKAKGDALAAQIAEIESRIGPE
jgi:murein DD-endopeptidase MepM/ murein hydrolase activator NlpD